MEEIAIKLAIVTVVALLIAVSWRSESALRSAARHIRAVAVRPKERTHAVTAYRIERGGLRGQSKK